MNPFDPMPTIKAILGMPIYEAIKESRAIAHLDNFEAPQCDVAAHVGNPNVQGHSGPASFFLITPCHHREGYLCTPIAEWLKAHGDVACECGQRLYGPHLTFIPLGDVK